MPFGFAAASGEVFDTVAAGGFVHGFTWSHNALGAAVGQRGAPPAARRRARRAEPRSGRADPRGPRRALEGSAAVGDVRGLGMMIGVELVRDARRRSRSPASDHVTERVVAAAREAGLLLYSSTGHADGTNGDLVMLGPPFVLTDDEAAHLVERTAAAIRSVRVSDRVGLVLVPGGADLRPRPAASAPARAGAAHLGPDRRVRAGRRGRTSNGSGSRGGRRRHDRARPHARVRRRDAAGRPRRGRATGGGSATAPATTRSSTGCTRRARSWRAPASRPPARSGRGASSTRSTRRAACTTRCPRARPGSACTTTRPSRSPGCWSTARSASPTSTWTCTTATARRRSSTTTRACSRSRSTSTRRWFFPGTGSYERGGRGAAGTRSTCRSRRARATTRGSPRSGPSSRRWCGALEPDVLVTQLGVRHPPHRPAGAAAAHDRGVPGGGGEAARAGARGGRRPVGRDRRRRLPVGAGRSARVDDRLRRDGGRRDPRRAPRGVDREGGVRAARRSADDVLRAGARSGDGDDGARDVVAAVRAIAGSGGCDARTKLVCTLGPATDTPGSSGVSYGGSDDVPHELLARVPAEHARMVRLVRDAEAGAGVALSPCSSTSPARRSGSARCTRIR